MSQTQAAKQQAWVSQVVAQFEGPLTLYASRLLRDAEHARDVVQETFLKLCAADPAALDGHVAEWLFTVCRNRALDVLRKEHRMTQLRDEQVHHCLSPAPGPMEAALKGDLVGHVLDLLESLPINQREVVRLRFQNSFSYQEISRITGLSVSNVGFLIHAGIKTLRGKLCEGQAAELHV